VQNAFTTGAPRAAALQRARVRMWGGKAIVETLKGIVTGSGMEYGPSLPYTASGGTNASCLYMGCLMKVNRPRHAVRATGGGARGSSPPRHRGAVACRRLTGRLQ